MKAVEALRAELEEEEQELGGAPAASVSEDAQSDEASSQESESESVQQAAAAGAGAGDADSDSDQDASLPNLTCKLATLSMHTTQTMLHRLNDPAAIVSQQCTVMQSSVLVHASASLHGRLHVSCIACNRVMLRHNIINSVTVVTILLVNAVTCFSPLWAGLLYTSDIPLMQMLAACNAIVM